MLVAVGFVYGTAKLYEVLPGEFASGLHAKTGSTIIDSTEEVQMLLYAFGSFDMKLCVMRFVVLMRFVMCCSDLSQYKTGIAVPSIDLSSAI